MSLECNGVLCCGKVLNEGVPWHVAEKEHGCQRLGRCGYGHVWIPDSQHHIRSMTQDCMKCAQAAEAVSQARQ